MGAVIGLQIRDLHTCQHICLFGFRLADCLIINSSYCVRRESCIAVPAADAKKNSLRVVLGYISSDEDMHRCNLSFLDLGEVK